MATLEQIQSRLKKLQAQAEVILAKKTQAAVEQIQALMLKHGLTTADIEAYAGAAKGGAKRGPKAGAKHAGNISGATAVKRAVPQSKGKLPPKYINPKTGETWSGYARPPAWIKDVKDRTRFLIASGADAAIAASSGATNKSKEAIKKSSTTAGATALKGQPKGPQPAKYRDPKSGATWSGRGPAPAWLAGANDRTKFLIDASGSVATDAATVGKTSKPKAAGKSRAVGKKAVDKS